MEKELSGENPPVETDFFQAYEQEKSKLEKLMQEWEILQTEIEDIQI